MLLPEIFGRNVFDDFFERPFNMTGTNAMRADVRETEKAYEVTVDLPGVKKEDVKAELSDGCLTISAETSCSRDSRDEDGSYIRRERYSGTCSRSFYIGDNVRSEDIKAKFADGLLQLDIPKLEETVSQNRIIAIE